ncbi:hypothetical protein BDN72DRAFT_849984 [Pluteus cervinus]|uniref:Uncharacterized protein n=1 Tax=Pluteus cervinus TaxID=181527 RepID=A0ACD3A5S9_9AGAR|nr:hypothetical protein BDN72DRAFT_849984 [Pluteus cervinus]
MPHFYEVVIFHYTSDFHVPHRNLSLQHLAENGKHVRHMLLHSGSCGIGDGFSVCIDKCPNLRSLALWINDNPYSPELVQSLLRLRLEFLSFNIHGFSAALKKQGASPISLPTVTHLELLGTTTGVDARLIRASFPALTHLALISPDRNPITVLRDALDIFGDQLKLVTWYRWDYRTVQASPTVECTSNYIVIDEPRFVVLSCGPDFINGWHEGVKGGLGIWRAATEAVEARRAGIRESV